MPRFVTVSETARPPDETFDFVTDLTQWATFSGYGPIPGIAEARLVDGGSLGVGARIRVTNTDRSVHHERIVAFERGRLLALTMELAPPVSGLLAAIHERVEIAPVDGGSRVTRRFDVQARSVSTSPLAWLLSRFLQRAVRAHDAAVRDVLGRP